MPDDPLSAPAGVGEPPKSPAVVKKTTLAKTPAQIELEKKLSRLEDEVGSLKEFQSETTRFLADLMPGHAKPAAAAPAKGFLDDLAEDLGLED